ncbi:MAG: proteasome subunit alpha [Micromonosporaceae bacterium]|nr:proteasome subunit alpha [Micromonosporaceae bacterium]
MAMPFYASPEQLMRDKSEYARKGISRGRSVVVLTYHDGVLFVAENTSTALHKISEIYDRIGFAAVGRYNEFENLRMAGVRLADIRGYSYDRRDVNGRWLANTYAQTLGAIFTEQHKPFEVEICIAQLGENPAKDELYRITYDGSVADEPGFVAMGGQVDAISGVLRERHEDDASLSDSLHLAVEALGSVGGEGGKKREVPADRLEVAVLDRRRPGRAFRRVTGAALASLLGREAEAPPATPPAEEPETSGDDVVDEIIDELAAEPGQPAKQSGRPETAKGPRPAKKAAPRKSAPRKSQPKSEDPGAGTDGP